MANLTGGSFLNEIFQSDPRLGTLLQRMISGINNVAKNSGVAPVGQVAAPPPPDSVNVKASGETAQIVITNNGPVDRAVNHFTEVDTSPAFTNPIVHHHGATRSPVFITLPTKTDGGTATHNWYFRSYTQKPGGPPSAPTTFGGSASPTAVQMTGSTQFTPLASTGSGTAPANGQAAGQGFGKQPTRPPAGPRRQAGSQ
jgi:hypothetical protein